MRILVATPWIHPHGGGLERYAHDLSARMAAQGHEIVCVGHAPAPFEDELDGLRRVGVAPGVKLSNTPLSLALRRRVRALLREEAFDVVSVHTPVPGSAELAALEARRARVPYVVTYHAGVLGPGKGLLALAAATHRMTFERLLLGGAFGLVAVSPYVAEHVFRNRPAAIVPPGVDATRFSPGGKEAWGRVLFVGPVSRAYAWKGFSTLFEAFGRLAVRRPEATLRVVGAGDLVESYQNEAARRGLAARVSFAGRVPDQDLVDEYRAASVVVLPSTSPAESFGMVLAEANACGRPVVASRVGGIPSFVEDGVNGLLAPPGDADALAAALQRVLADADLAAALGRAGREKVLAHHRWEDLAARALVVCHEAAARRGGSSGTRAALAARKSS